MSLESRLKRLEEHAKQTNVKIFVFSVGEGESFDFTSEEQFEEELKKPKYENAIIIRDDWI